MRNDIPSHSVPFLTGVQAHIECDPLGQLRLRLSMAPEVLRRGGMEGGDLMLSLAGGPELRLRMAPVGVHLNRMVFEAVALDHPPMVRQGVWSMLSPRTEEVPE